MKKRNFNLFLMALCTISLGLFSASNPNDVEEPGEIDEGNTLKKRVTAGSQCTDFIKNNKKLAKVTRGRPKEGTNLKRNGKDKFFLSIGTDSVVKLIQITIFFQVLCLMLLLLPILKLRVN